MPYQDQERQRREVKRLNRQALERLRQYVDDYKSARGCAWCGERDPVVLDLHHRDPTAKEGTVSRLINQRRPIANIDAELVKCVVVCANDHRRIHAGTIEVA